MKKAQTQNKKLYITAEQDGYTIITNNITRNNLLSDGAKSLYIYLKSHNETFNLSIESIAHYLNKSISAINRSIKELKEAGFLKLERKENKNTYTYTLLNSPKLELLKQLDNDFLIDCFCKGHLNFKDLKDLYKTKRISLSQYNEIIDKLVKIAKNHDWLDADE